MKYFYSMLIVISLVSCKTIKPLEPGTEPPLKKVTLDQFMNNELSKSLPISFLIPQEYELAKIEAPLTYAYWMTPDGAEQVGQTKDLPVGSGWLYGKVTMSVGYDETSDKFLGTENLKEQARIGGFSLIKSERFSVSDFPVMTLEMEHNASGKTLYSLYIGMKLETNAIYLSYREPTGKKAVGRYVWDNLINSMKSSAQ